MNIDIGKYNKSSELYEKLILDLYEKYSDGVSLPPEYAYFVQENMIHFLIRLARYKFVARQLKKTDNILEVGCGSGLGSIFLSQHCNHVTGIDTKLTEILEGKKINNRNNLDLLHQDLFNFSPSEKFDVIVAIDVIEHLTKEQGDKLLNRMSKLLKSTGMLIIGTPSIYSYPYQGPLSRASHIKCYDKIELIDLIENHFSRTIAYSMNDEIVHTGHDKMAWYYFVLSFYPKIDS